MQAGSTYLNAHDHLILRCKSQHIKAKQSKASGRANQSNSKQSKAKQGKAKQSKATQHEKQGKAKQSKATQNETIQMIAKQRKAINQANKHGLQLTK